MIGGKNNEGYIFFTKTASWRNPEELKKYFCLSSEQYQRIIASLQEIRKNGAKK
jgi:hypothetical protein